MKDVDWHPQMVLLFQLTTDALWWVFMGVGYECLHSVPIQQVPIYTSVPPLYGFLFLSFFGGIILFFLGF